MMTSSNFIHYLQIVIFVHSFGKKSILEVPDTGTWVLDNTRPILHSSIVSFWITPACSKERKYHIHQKCSGIHQFWDVPVSGTWSVLFPDNTKKNNILFSYINLLGFLWLLF